MHEAIITMAGRQPRRIKEPNRSSDFVYSDDEVLGFKGDAVGRPNGRGGVQRFQPKTNSADGNSAENVLYIKPFYTNYVIHIRGYTHISYITLK